MLSGLEEGLSLQGSRGLGIIDLRTQNIALLLKFWINSTTMLIFLGCNLPGGVSIEDLKYLMSATRWVLFGGGMS
jgi:hypothetical protein